MNIDSNRLFYFNDDMRKIRGLWKPKGRYGLIKIKYSHPANQQACLIISTQSLAQRVFNALLKFVTCGHVSNYFADHRKYVIAPSSSMNFDKIKTAVTKAYQENAESADILAQKFFRDFNVLLERFPRGGKEDQIEEKEDQIEESVPLSPSQQIVAERLGASIILMLQATIAFFSRPDIRNMKPGNIEDYNALIAAAWSGQPLDTSEDSASFKQLIKQIMIELDKEVDKLQGLKLGFDMLTAVTQDPNIRHTILEGIAYPFVQKLIEEFKKID